MSDDGKAPAAFGKELGFYEMALTKDDHDRMTRNRRRNLTDGPVGSRSSKGSPVTDEEGRGSGANARKELES